MDINDKFRWIVQSRDCIRSQPRTESHSSLLISAVNLSPHILFSRRKSSFVCVHNDLRDDSADRNKPNLEWLPHTRHTLVYLRSQLVYRGATQSLPVRWDAPNFEMQIFLQKLKILGPFQSSWPQVNIEVMFQKRARNRSIVNFFAQFA